MIPNLLETTIVPKSSITKKLEVKEAYNNAKVTSLEPKRKETPHPHWMNCTNQ
jgi:hypothetical protein